MNLKRCRLESDVNNKGNIIAKLYLTNIFYKLKNCATEGYRFTSTLNSINYVIV